MSRLTTWNYTNRKRSSNNPRGMGTSKKNLSKMTQHIITKRIAKHGSQSIIVIPRLLEKDLKPGTIAKITIDVIEKIAKRLSPLLVQKLG